MHPRRVVIALLACSALTACHEPPLVAAYSATEELAVACQDGDFTLEATTPEVMLVLDRSSSMANTFSAGTRWTNLVAALERALPAVNSQMALGLTLFPGASTGQECAAPTAPELLPAVGQVSDILSKLRVSRLIGGTPTAEALDVAARQLDSAHPRALVLATDGLPNCNPGLNPATCACSLSACPTAYGCTDDARTLARLSAWTEAGIPTWVIGIGNDVAGNALLDAMALAGGRPNATSPRYVQALSTEALDAALAQLRDELTSCVFTASSVPDTAGTAVLSLDGVFVPYDASGVNGWSWSSQARGELALRGDWCRKAIAATDPVVRLSVSCGAEAADLEQVISQ